ncbi:MAG TPA: hypothetical protein VH682_23745 [Gemmataceae bacterium]
MNTMDGHPTLDPWMLDPADRRRWLLAKALETASLAEALSLVQAAEDFLLGNPQEAIDRLPGPAPTATPSHMPTAFEMGNQSSEALEGLTSLVSIDDVIRYLRRCDEDVASETDNAEALLARANHKRRNQGLPSFVLLSAVPTQAPQPAKPVRAKEVAPPRPPTARERAEWARRAVALAAA